MTEAIPNFEVMHKDKTLRAIPIELPGTYIPELKGKEILLIVEPFLTTYKLIEVRSLNPKYLETGNPYIENDTPESLKMTIIVHSKEPPSQDEMGKIIEEASARYFKRLENASS